MLDKDFNEVWSISGNAPIASPPLVHEDHVFVQFHDNSIYLLDRKTGAVKTAYTYYAAGEEISFIRLAQPFYVEDKIVFGFSNGMVFYFHHRKNPSTGTEELIPWFQIRTSGPQRSFDKKNFYDLLSIVPVKDTIVFSGGEYGGIILDGKKNRLENMRNLQLVKEEDNSITGYGEGGIFLFDETGNFLSRPFESTNYVTNNINADGYRVVTTTGAGSMIAFNEGFIYLLSNDYSEILYSIMVPNGISAKGIYHQGSIYLLSDMGVLYKLNISK